MKGKLICIEGADGVGKSTLFDNLKKEYKNKNYKFYIDDGSLELCDKIKQIVTNYEMNATSQTLLFTACRYEVYQKVKEDLSNGINVIMDRSYYSTIVYQGFCGGQDYGYIMDINRDIPMADILIILNCEYEKVECRLNKKDTLDLFEKDNFIKQKARAGYMELYNNNIEGIKIPKNTILIDTSMKTQYDTLSEVNDYLNKVVGDKK